MRQILQVLFLVIVMFEKNEGSVIECDSYLLNSQQFFRNGATLKSTEGSATCFIKNYLQGLDGVDICSRSIEELIKMHTDCSSLQYLSAKNSTMLKFPSNFFKAFPNVKTFTANNVNLMQIYRDDFKFAGNLQQIQFYGNMIASLEDGIISHLTSLYIFDLSNNKITSLTEKTFIGASETLYELNLSGNKLTTLDFTVFIPIASREQYPLELNLDNNEIKDVRESHRVNHLYFQIIKLKNNHIPAFSCPDVVMEEVILDGNNMQTISLDNCSVEYMSVARNNLKFLQIHSELKAIDASENKIMNIVVDEKSQMTQMAIKNAENISQLLPAISKMTELKFLNISNSNIRVLNENTFADMKNLNYLYMRACNIKIIPFETFVNNGKLHTLDIANNKLETIDLHMFTGLKELNLLDISFNNLSRIANIENIKNVLPELKEIVIEGNPWKCSDLSIIVRALNQLNIKFIEEKNKNFGVQNVYGIPCH